MRIAAVHVIKVDIEQTNVYHCAMSPGPVTFNLTDESFLGEGTVRWTGGPTNEFLGEGDPVSFSVPTNWPAGVHTITARSTLLTNCLDEATLTLVQMEFTALNHVCTVAVHNCSHDLTFTVTPASLGTNITLELKPVSGSGAAEFTSNSFNIETITGTATLSLLGTQASSAVSNMVLEARLGTCVCTQTIFTVVDVIKLTATDAENASNNTNDTTQADDTHALYLGQGTNGTAALVLDLTWKPDAYPEAAFLWDIIPAGGSSGAAEWGGITNGSFVDQPLTNTWDVANAAGGVTNREFQVRAWFDCNTNGLYDADEPHRIIDVIVIKVDLVEITPWLVIEDEGSPGAGPDQEGERVSLQKAENEARILYDILPIGLDPESVELTIENTGFSMTLPVSA